MNLLFIFSVKSQSVNFTMIACFWKFRFFWSVGTFSFLNNVAHLKFWQYFNYLFDKNSFTFIPWFFVLLLLWEWNVLKIMVFPRPLFQVCFNSDLSFFISSEWLIWSFKWLTSNKLLSILSSLSLKLAEFGWRSSNTALVNSFIFLIKLNWQTQHFNF